MRGIIYLALALVLTLQGCGSNDVKYDFNGAQASPTGSPSSSPTSSVTVSGSPTVSASPTVSPSPRL